MIVNGRPTNGCLDPAHVPAKRRAVLKICPACGLKQFGGRRTCEDAKCNYEFRTKMSYRKKTIVPVETIEQLTKSAQIAPPPPPIQTKKDPIDTAVRALVDAIKINLVADKPTNSIHDDIKALREENRQLRADIAALADSVKYFRIFMTESLGLEIPKPIITIPNGIRVAKKKILVVGLDSNKNQILKNQLSERADLVFLDNNIQSRVPGAHFAITTLCCGHSVSEKVANTVGSKNHKHIMSTNIQDVMKTILDFLSRQ